MISFDTPATEVKSVKKLMVGKTIKAISEESCNCLSIEFTDGTELLLESETLNGIPAIVGYVRKTLVIPSKK